MCVDRDTENGTSPRSPGAAAGPDEGPITADPVVQNESDDEDTNSILTSSTASLSESINEYRRIQGRTYTQKVDYYAPNDEKQNEALDINHWWTTIFLGDKLHLSPLGTNVQRALDVGTGTGIWAIDFADENPSAEVIGVDVSPIQPTWTPPNCKFQIDDIEQPWTWPENYFDYIHVRNLEGCLADWPEFYRQAFKALRPGGYIEIKEHDIELKSQVGPLPDDHILKSWPRSLLKAAGILGKAGLQCLDHGIAKGLRAAGFADVVEKKFPVPAGGWASDPVLKEAGLGFLAFLDQSLEGFGMFLLKEVLGWEVPEILVSTAEYRKAIRDSKLQPFMEMHVVYARKPEAEPEAEA